MSTSILVDSPAIWESIQADLASAHKYAYIQTYSFEGDWVGSALTDAYLAADAEDRRLLIDSYTRANQNDRWIALPGTLFDPEFRAELRNTKRLVGTLRDDGVGVRFGRPFGFLARKFFSRDHKKLLLFDDQVAYLGGINFSEHNFDWHDMMLRIEHPEVTEFLRQDFQHSWDGRSTESSRSFADLDMDLHLLSGEGNRRAFGRVLRLIDDAERSIVVISPYLGPPFTEHMAAAVKRGVEVRIVTPDNNNKSYLKQYVLAEAARAGFEVWLLQERMIHMKCMLIDDRVLITGSSNFDLMSYNNFLAEVVAICRNPEVIGAFRRQVLEPDLAASKRYDEADGGPGFGLRTIPIRAASVLARILSPG